MTEPPAPLVGGVLVYLERRPAGRQRARVGGVLADALDRVRRVRLGGVPLAGVGDDVPVVVDEPPAPLAAPVLVGFERRLALAVARPALRLLVVRELEPRAARVGPDAVEPLLCLRPGGVPLAGVGDDVPVLVDEPPAVLAGRVLEHLERGGVDPEVVRGCDVVAQLRERALRVRLGGVPLAGVADDLAVVVAEPKAPLVGGVGVQLERRVALRALRLVRDGHVRVRRVGRLRAVVVGPGRRLLDRRLDPEEAGAERVPAHAVEALLGLPAAAVPLSGGRDDVAVAVAEPPARLPARVLEQLEPGLALAQRRDDGLRGRQLVTGRFEVGLCLREIFTGRLQLGLRRRQLATGRRQLLTRLLGRRGRRGGLVAHALVVLVDGVREQGDDRPRDPDQEEPDPVDGDHGRVARRGEPPVREDVHEPHDAEDAHHRAEVAEVRSGPPEREPDHGPEHHERRGQRGQRVPDAAGDGRRLGEEKHRDAGEAEQHAEAEQPVAVHLVGRRRRADSPPVQSAAVLFVICCHMTADSGQPVICSGD